MAFKFKVGHNSSQINLPSYGSIITREADEIQFSGQVQGQQASEPEERLARALDNANLQYIFRYIVGAPKGLPGWKEVDFIVASGGLIYAIEVDTAFTHRNKRQKDKLHDAIIQNDQGVRSLGTLFPEVIHADGDSELADENNAENFVKQRIGK